MKFFLYVMVITIPLSLSLTAWQAVRYDSLKKETRRLNTAQEELVLSNKSIITEISALSSPERLEKIARDSLGLSKKTPEDMTVINVGE